MVAWFGLVGVPGECHGVCVGDGLWDAYDRMGLSFQQHAADSAYNAHYDRPAMLAALGPVAGRRVLDAACSPSLYLRELLERGAEVTGFDASPIMVGLARQQAAGRARIDQAVLGEPLSPRELVVLALLAAGKPNREIAEELVISLDTAKRHVTHILDKLGVANRTQAVTRARELGLLRKTARRPSAPAANATDHSLGVEEARLGSRGRLFRWSGA